MDEPTWRNSYPQIIGACIVHLLNIQAGTNMAFSAILIPELDQADSDLRIKDGEGAWIASLVTITAPIGALLSGPLMDKFERRNIGLFMCILNLVSWLITYWSYNVTWLYIARVITGAATGFFSVTIIYTPETTNPLLRPMLLGLSTVFASFGVLLTSIFGLWFHWRTVAVIFAVLTAAIFCVVLILPESPHWFLQFGNGTRDKKSLKWFNRDSSQAESSTLLGKETLREKWEGLKKPELYKPIVLLLVIFLFQQTSGSYVITFYAVGFFKDLGGEFGSLNESSAMVVMGVLRFIMAVVALMLSRRFGRRTLSIVSGLGMGITMILASGYLQFTVTQLENEGIVLGLVLLHVSFAEIGWHFIPWSLMSELLPTRARAVVGGILLSYAHVVMFVVVQTFPALVTLVAPKGVFLLFSIASFSGMLFVWKYLPETLGKTLAEIEQGFK